jgi:hypothetical protein
MSVLCPQVAAHGTGASLPTVEEQIVSMKIISPALYVTRHRSISCFSQSYASAVYGIISSAACLTR